MHNIVCNGFSLALSAALVMAAGCHQMRRQPALPETIPQPPEVRLSSRAEGWPPRPENRTNVVNVPYSTRPDLLTARQTQLRQIATQDVAVRQALGERFGFVTATHAEADKVHPPSAIESLPIWLTFYSYSNNVAVDVLMGQGNVAEVVRREGYQPPEGAEEIENAIALARRSARLRNAVRGMHATAILTAPDEGAPGYGHRVLHVSFSATSGPEEVPKYAALVDLTKSEVIEVRDNRLRRK